MAGEAAEFLLSLGDSVTPNAVKIASSLEGMSAATQKAITQAVKLDAQMAKTAANNAKAAQASAKAALDTAKLAEVNGTAATSSGELAGKLGDLAGSSTNAGGAVGKLQGMLAELGPEGAVVAAALGVAAIAVTATVGTLVAMASAAIGVIEQREGLLATFSALGGGAAAGASTLAMVDKLGTQLPIATAQLGEWAQGLQRAGLAGKDLENATRAIAAASALNPAGGAAAAQETIAKLASGGKEATDLVKSVAEGSKKGTSALREMGLTVADIGGKAAVAKMSAAQLSQAIEKALQKKGAGPLDEMANTWPAIIGKAKEGLLSIFDGLGPAVKPFMAAVKSLFGEFNKGGGVTKGIKPIITDVLTTVFSWATKAVNAVHGIVEAFTQSGKSGGVLNTVVGYLKTGWAALGAIWTSLKAALSPIIAGMKAIFTNAMVLDGIKTIFKVIATVIGVVIVVVAGLAAAFVVVAATISAVVGAIVGSVMGLVGLIEEGVSGTIDALGGLASGAIDAASNFIAGLVGGIAAGAGAVADAVKGLASGALSAFTGALGIHSPSTIMLEHGEDNIAGAAATGVDRGAPKMEQAMGRLGAPPSGKGRSGGKDAGGGGGFSAVFNNCIFGGDLTQEKVDEMMAAWWDRMEGEAGAAPAGP